MGMKLGDSGGIRVVVGGCGARGVGEVVKGWRDGLGRGFRNG